MWLHVGQTLFCSNILSWVVRQAVVYSVNLDQWAWYVSVLCSEGLEWSVSLTGPQGISSKLINKQCTFVETRWALLSKNRGLTPWRKWWFGSIWICFKPDFRTRMTLWLFSFLNCPVCKVHCLKKRPCSVFKAI